MIVSKDSDIVLVETTTFWMISKHALDHIKRCSGTSKKTRDLIRVMNSILEPESAVWVR